MNVAVDKMMEARNYDGVASKMKADSKKTARKATAQSSEAIKTVFPFMADLAQK